MIGTCLYEGVKLQRIGICGGLVSLLVFSFFSYPMSYPGFLIAFLLLLVSCCLSYSRRLIVVLAFVAGIAGAWLVQCNTYDACRDWLQCKTLYDIHEYDAAEEGYNIVIFSFPYALDKERMVLGNELFYCKRCVALPGEEYQWEWQQKKHCIHLPKAGEILALDSTNYKDYRKCIEYETRKQTYCRDNVILLEDSVIVNYRFRHDYYFMCGDNTNDSYDSRFWGLLSDDFILGVGRFIWFSKNPYTGEIRWNRIFKGLL